MAQEYLKRTTTSGGNRKKWTWAGWVKLAGTTHSVLFSSDGSSDSTRLVLGYYNNDFYVWGTSVNFIQTRRKVKDCGNWHHVLVKFDSTQPQSGQRLNLYINGVIQEDLATDNRSSFGQNGDYGLNRLGIHAIGRDYGAGAYHANANITDMFFVDGQALTPDVFGFFKDGQGYQSDGVTLTNNATEFNPGRWCPHAPRKIKSDIERRGGFGVNGYYLPLNDKSNPGADFHCDPNTIIKLKGEDLPQPQNGAPATSDAFVSQVRKEKGSLGFDGCVSFGGDTDYLQVDDNDDLDLGSSDFTIEAFIYPTGIPNGTYANIFAKGYPIQCYYMNTESISFYLATGATSGGYNIINNSNLTGTGSIKMGRWTHFAICRSGNTLKAFVNGEEKYSASTPGTIASNALPFTIGTYGPSASSYEFKGFISNFRVIKGTALYSSDFTKPTEPLTAVTNTKLLCCNSSTSATASTVTPATITATGDDIFATTSELTGSLVFAIPGIAVNMITNGTFDTNTTGWTATNAVISSVDGTLKVDDSANVGSWSSAYQTVTTIAGHSYRLEVDILSGNDARFIGIKQGSYTANSGAGPDSSLNYTAETPKAILDFTATGTSVTIMLTINNNGVGYFDNVVLYDFAAVDYSSHIRGSGSNKTVSSVTYNSRTPTILPGDSAYGSFIDIDSPSNTGGYIDVADSTAFDSINLTTAEWTVEAWIKRGAIGGSGSIIFQFGQQTDYATASCAIHSSGRLWSIWSYDGSSWGVLDSTGGPVVPQDEWVHLAWVKEAYPTSKSVLYLNGVPTKVIDIPQNFTYASPNSFRIGGHYRGPNSGGDGYYYNGSLFDARFYGIAKYRGGFDVSRPYNGVGIEDYNSSTDSVRNNFATFNGLIGAGTASGDNNPSLTIGNLFIDNKNQIQTQSTLGMRTGKWYCEMRLKGSSVAATGYIGVVGDMWAPKNNQNVYANPGFSHIRPGTGTNSYTKNWTASSLTTANPALGFDNDDIFGIALDLDSSPKTVKYFRNGTLIHTDSTVGSNNTYVGEDFYFLAMRTNDGVSGANWSDVTGNFGQNPTFFGDYPGGTYTDDNGKGLFKYQPPSGYLALCESNLSTPTIPDPGKFFKTVLYNGNGEAGLNISKVGFKPDMIWIKHRGTINASGGLSHNIYDSVRGPGQRIQPDLNNAESDLANGGGGGGVMSFDDDGFTLGNSTDDVNYTAGKSYVAWCWKAGGAPVGNNDGSITTQVSANKTSGFSVVTGTMTSGTDTLGHGLGKAPQMIITKQRNGTTEWYTYHRSMGYDRAVKLNDNGASFSFSHWVSHPDDSIFKMGSGFGSGEEYVAYCFTEIEGYSKIGLYVGNSSNDGPFVYCGFRPAWVMIKNADSTGQWCIWDSARTPHNEMQNALRANTAATETNGFQFDFYSNGFKARDNELSVNQSGHNILYMAFAESPFQTANAK
jgi:hypothetical protein